MPTPRLIVLFLSLTHLVTCSKWFPPVPAASENHRELFRLVNFPDLQERFLAQFVDKLKFAPNNVNHLDGSHFQWTSVTMFRESKSSKSWLIVAGFSTKRNLSETAFTNDFSAVLGCQVNVLPDKPAGFDISTCEILGLDTGTPASNHSDAGLLGKGLQSLQLLNGGVVVFCDPLWHSNQGTKSPGGRCSVLERTNETWQSAGTVEFCSSSGRTHPCAGGFSIDLRLSEGGTNAQLLTGIPFSQPNRRVRTVDSLLRHAHQHIRDIESEEEAFGTSVAWSPYLSGRSDALAVVGSPSASVRGFQVNSLEEDISTELLRMNGTTFGGLGFAVETGLVGSSVVVFAGAPFEEVEKLGSNAGRMYAQFMNTEGVHNFSLEGFRSGEMFGYAIARVGDVDGDGIDEVAVSAPAIDAENVTGRVYIHRVLPEFRIEKEPLQILEAPTNVAGFGVSLSRSIDIDSDGGPELAVTTLDPKVPVLVYSLPLRLRAKCAFKTLPRVAVTSLRKDEIVTLKITINLIDAITGKPFPAHASFKTRSHQINPDVLWLKRYNYLNSHSNQSDLLLELLTNRESFKLDPSQPRFTFEEISDVLISHGGSITLDAKIRAQEDPRYMDLHTVPLHVAFRSILADPQCDRYTQLCPKSTQPLIDWSDCVWKMAPPKYICPPHPQCSADLQIYVKGSGDSHTPVQFGRREDANQTITFVLRNNGPTKSEGVRVLLNTIGWPKNASKAGLRVLINSVHLRDASTGSFLASNKRSTDRWLISLLSNGAAALIAAQQGTALYPDQELFVAADIFLAGLVAARYEEEEEEGDKRSEGGTSLLPSPGLIANVSAAVEDPNNQANIVAATFDVIYKPQLRINPGAAPPALVDERKEPPQLNSATKVTLGNEIGPQLEHVFLVENFGTVDLFNLTFQLDVPVGTDDGDTLLYLTNRARLLGRSTSDYIWVNTLPKMVSANGSEVGFCDIEEEFVNPFNLTIREAASGQSSHSDKQASRRRRSIGQEEALTPDRVTFTSPFGDNRVDVYFKRSGQRQTTISCTIANSQFIGRHSSGLDFKVICARVTCRLAKLQRADAVRLTMTGWLWTPTFFKHKLPDVKFVSRLSLVGWGERPQILLSYPSVRLDLPYDPPAYELPQTVVFRGVTGKYQSRTSLWPIIVGIVLGSILLFSLIASLYCCGFFRRRQRTNEARRKSRIAAAARSRPPVYALNDHPTTFLLNGKDSTLNGRNTAIYTANPMHALSPATQSSIPSPREDITEAQPDSNSAQGHSIKEAQQEIDQGTPDQKTTDRKDDRDPSPSSSSGLPDWLMSEIKKNEAKGKKSKSSKIDS